MIVNLKIIKASLQNYTHSSQVATWGITRPITRKMQLVISFAKLSFVIKSRHPTSSRYKNTWGFDQNPAKSILDDVIGYYTDRNRLEGRTEAF